MSMSKAEKAKEVKAKAKSETVKEPIKAPLPARIHIDEFVTVHTDLNPMQKAGLRATCGKDWMRLGEWEKALKKYTGK